MLNRTWQETEAEIGMPAARDVEQSIVLAQLAILRHYERRDRAVQRELERFIAIAEGRDNV